MSELEPEGIEYLAFIPESEMHTTDGTLVRGAIYSNMDPEGQREVIADIQGLQPEEVMFADETSDDPKVEKARRIAVAFSSSHWNSSWDPNAPKGDPSLN